MKRLAFLLSTFLICPCAGFASTKIVAVVNSDPITSYDVSSTVALSKLKARLGIFSASEINLDSDKALIKQILGKLGAYRNSYFGVQISAAEYNSYADEVVANVSKALDLSPKEFMDILESTSLKEYFMAEVLSNLSLEACVGQLIIPKVYISQNHVDKLLELVDTSKGLTEVSYQILRSKDLSNASYKKMLALRSRIAKKPSKLSEKAYNNFADSHFEEKQNVTQIPANVRSVIRAMDAGQTSSVLRGDTAFYIVQLTDKKVKASDQEYAIMRNDIKSNKISNEMAKINEKVRANTYIEMR